MDKKLTFLLFDRPAKKGELICLINPNKADWKKRNHLFYVNEVGLDGTVFVQAPNGKLDVFMRNEYAVAKFPRLEKREESR